MMEGVIIALAMILVSFVLWILFSFGDERVQENHEEAYFERTYNEEFNHD